MDAVERVRALTGLEMQPLQAARHLQARAALAQMGNLRAAIGAPVSEDAVTAALRVADAYRARVIDLEEQVENLKRSNAALRLAAEADRAKAALIDHALTAEDSHLVLCEAQYLPAQRRWTFSPLSELAEAQAVMDRDIEASQDADEAECHACAGTGEGQHEGASCAACGGRGH